jgi:hypothetical protein
MEDLLLINVDLETVLDLQLLLDRYIQRHAPFTMRDR